VWLAPAGLHSFELVTLETCECFFVFFYFVEFVDWSDHLYVGLLGLGLGFGLVWFGFDGLG
jgi:hypothetical protein